MNVAHSQNIVDGVILCDEGPRTRTVGTGTYKNVSGIH